MSILTWRNVPTPDLASESQAGIRTAADLLNRAVGNASTAVAQQQQFEAQQKAAEQSAADKFVLERMLKIQDPKALAQASSDGSLVGPAADKVSAAMLGQIDARRDVLRTRENEAYTDARVRSQNAGEDLLAPIFAKYTSSAVRDPARALAGFYSEAKATGAPLPAIEKTAAELRQMWIDPTGMMNARNSSQNRADQVFAADLVGKYRGLGDNPDAKLQLMNAARKQNPLGAWMAETMLNGAGENATKEVLSSRPDFGLSSDAVKYVPSDVQGAVVTLGAALEEKKQGLTAGAKAIIAARGMESLNEGDVALKIADEFRKGGIEKPNVGAIRRYIGKATSSVKGVTAAQAGGLLLRHIEEDGPLSAMDIAENVDTNVDDFIADVKSIPGARKEVQDLEKDERAHASTMKLVDELAQAERNAEAQKRKAKANPEAAEAARKAEEIVKKKRESLKRHVFPGKGLLQDAKGTQDGSEDQPYSKMPPILQSRTPPTQVAVPLPEDLE